MAAAEVAAEQATAARRLRRPADRRRGHCQRAGRPRGTRRRRLRSLPCPSLRYLSFVLAAPPPSPLMRLPISFAFRAQPGEVPAQFLGRMMAWAQKRPDSTDTPLTGTHAPAPSCLPEGSAAAPAMPAGLASAPLAHVPLLYPSVGAGTDSGGLGFTASSGREGLGSGVATGEIADGGFFSEYDESGGSQRRPQTPAELRQQDGESDSVYLERLTGQQFPSQTLSVEGRC